MDVGRRNGEEPVKVIWLTRGLFSVVDDEDYERLNQFKWHVVETNGCYYAMRSIRAGGERSAVLMHRAVLFAEKGQLVDHRDGRGLDNRKKNLRLADSNSNAWNQRKTDRPKSSRYKGVTFCDRPELKSKWKAALTVRGKCVLQKMCATEEDAARIYDEVARHHFGEFACLNFPQLSDNF